MTARFSVPVLFDELYEPPPGGWPRLGDQVHWCLSWGELVDYRLPTLFGARAAVVVLPPPDPAMWRNVSPSSGPAVPPSVPALVTAGALTVRWSAPVPVPTSVVLTGVLGVHRYNAPGPATTGAISRLRAVSWEHRRASNGAWERVVGTHRLTDVWQVPDEDRISGAAIRHGRCRLTNAVLVDLDVAA